jgi:predicted Zn-dependent protease with MMP-like domain
MGRRADGGEGVGAGRPRDWQEVAAPSLDDFQVLAEKALEELPETFRDLCGAIEIRVADFADDEALGGLGIEDPFELLGLFEGVGLAQGGAESWSGRMPNRVWLYRRAILDYWCAHEETLGGIVTHVLVHEIGHHFGLSDDDMEALEAEAD